MGGVKRKPTSAIQTRASKSKEPIQWRLFIKVALVILCAIFGYSVYVNWSSLLENLDSTPIKSYALTHRTRFTTDADIREILSKEPVLKGYFGQNINEINERFLAVSWVKNVLVRKIYPNKLSITLVEYQPVARWNNKQYLSEQGVIFSLPEDRFKGDNLPILFGPDSESKVVLEAWNKIKQDLMLRNLALFSVEMDNRGAWTIRLDNGVALRLGRGDWLPKIDRFVAIFPQIDVPSDMRLSYVDLRYEHGAAVGFVKR